MDDVTQALEKAADAVGSANIDDDWDDIARAAVLACVQSLPPGMTVAELAAAIEKERT